MREATTATSKFRQLLREISLLLAYEVLRDLECTSIEIRTPLETMQAPKLEGKKLCFVSILRAGNGLLDGMLDLVPSARRSEEHTSELQSLMRISYAVFCLKKKMK